MPLHSGARLTGSPDFSAFPETGIRLAFSPAAYLFLRSSVARDLFPAFVASCPTPDSRKRAADSVQEIRGGGDSGSSLHSSNVTSGRDCAAGVDFDGLSVAEEGRSGMSDGQGDADVVYEEVSLLEFEYDALTDVFVYPCPCGDLFELSLGDLKKRISELEGQAAEKFSAIATCPSCSLRVKALFDKHILVQVQQQYSVNLLGD